MAEGRAAGRERDCGGARRLSSPALPPRVCARSRVGAPAAAVAVACNGVEAPRRLLPPVRRAAAAAAAVLQRGAQPPRAGGGAGAALRREAGGARRGSRLGKAACALGGRGAGLGGGASPVTGLLFPGARPRGGGCPGSAPPQGAAARPPAGTARLPEEEPPQGLRRCPLGLSLLPSARPGGAAGLVGSRCRVAFSIARGDRRPCPSLPLPLARAGGGGTGSRRCAVAGALLPPRRRGCRFPASVRAPAVAAPQNEASPSRRERRRRRGRARAGGARAGEEEEGTGREGKGEGGLAVGGPCAALRGGAGDGSGRRGPGAPVRRPLRAPGPGGGSGSSPRGRFCGFSGHLQVLTPLDATRGNFL